MLKNKLNQAFFKNLIEKNSKDLIKVREDEYQFRNKILETIYTILNLVFTNSAKGIILDPQSTKEINDFHKLLADSDIEAIGIHLFDEIIGRKSFMCKTSPELSAKSVLFSELWLRTYNYLLKPSSSLINYFYDNNVLWEDRSEELQLRWDEELESLRDNQINLNFSPNFIIQNSQIASELNEIINKYCCPPDFMVVSDEKNTLDLIFAKILVELDKKCINERLHESILLARLEILNDETKRKLFLKKIKLLSFKRNNNETLLNQDRYKDKIWYNLQNINPLWNEEKEAVRHLPSWKESKDLLEAFQSTILNQYSFCTSKGFYLYKLDEISVKYYKESKEIEGYLIVVSKDSTNDMYIRDICNNILKAIRAFCNRRTPKSKPNIGGKLENVLLLKISKTIQYENFLEEDVFTRWIDFVYKMAKESIHESKNIEFNVGIGPKYFHEVHLKKYIPPLENLISPSSNEVKIIHFLKSYFSLFEAKNNKIIWFDEQCHFLGIFEYPNEKELFSSYNSENLLLAKIKGKDFFELYKGSNTPVIRIKNNKYIDLNNHSKIREAIQIVNRKIFVEPPNYDKLEIRQSESSAVENVIINNFADFVDCIINKTKIAGIGTSYIIINDFFFASPNSKKTTKNSNLVNEWKVDFNSQSKNLSEQLKKYQTPVLSIEDLKRFNEFKFSEYFENTLNELLLLTRLDGSILIRLKNNGIHVNPSQFAIPLIMRKSQIEHFDYFKLRNSGTSLWENFDSKSLFQINSNFYENRVTEFNHLELFISDIDKGNGFIKDSNEVNLKNLTFLNSSGTRHHSLYGLSLSVKEPIYVVVISEDGNTRVFWNGLIFHNSSID